MKRLFYHIKKNYLYIIILGLILFLALFVRWNNLVEYNTWSADDGGAHVAYVDTILHENRLPNIDETYLAWHEPLYYTFVAAWNRFGNLFGAGGLNWAEGLNIIIYIVFLAIVWLLSYFYSNKNRYLALLNVFLFSFLFVGVKLSAYLTNELLAQTLILLLAFVFIFAQLLSARKKKWVVVWSIIAGLAVLTKLTAIIIVVAVLLTWIFFAILKNKKHLIAYVLITVILVTLINIPWLIYKKNNFGEVFSINSYEKTTKQNLLTSDAWKYFFAINHHSFTDYPFWFSKPYSFSAILLGDTFGDYYNLFNNPEKINQLPDNQKILVGNGRYTTPRIWQSMLLVNRVSLVVSLIWLIGFIAWLGIRIRKRQFSGYDLFLLLLFVGGWLALIYNNLRLPYLERGVLKAQFIFFTFPLLAIFAYSGLWQALRSKIVWVIICFVPIAIYIIFAWPMIYIN